jgi:hypothetical protein
MAQSRGESPSGTRPRPFGAFPANRRFEVRTTGREHGLVRTLGPARQSSWRAAVFLGSDRLKLIA